MYIDGSSNSALNAGGATITTGGTTAGYGMYVTGGTSGNTLSNTGFVAQRFADDASDKEQPEALNLTPTGTASIQASKITANVGMRAGTAVIPLTPPAAGADPLTDEQIEANRKKYNSDSNTLTNSNAAIIEAGEHGMLVYGNNNTLTNTGRTQITTTTTTTPPTETIDYFNSTITAKTGMEATGDSNTLSNLDYAKIIAGGIGMLVTGDKNTVNNGGYANITATSAGTGIKVTGDENTITNSGYAKITVTGEKGIFVTGNKNKIYNTDNTTDDGARVASTITVTGADAIGISATSTELPNPESTDETPLTNIAGGENTLENAGTILVTGTGTAQGLYADGNRNILDNRSDGEIIAKGTTLATGLTIDDITLVDDTPTDLTDDVTLAAEENTLTSSGTITLSATAAAGEAIGLYIPNGNKNELTNNGTINIKGISTPGALPEDPPTFTADTGNGYGLYLAKGNENILQNSGSIDIIAKEKAVGLFVADGQNNTLANNGSIKVEAPTTAYGMEFSVSTKDVAKPTPNPEDPEDNIDTNVFTNGGEIIAKNTGGNAYGMYLNRIMDNAGIEENNVSNGGSITVDAGTNYSAGMYLHTAATTKTTLSSTGTVDILGDKGHDLFLAMGDVVVTDWYIGDLERLREASGLTENKTIFLVNSNTGAASLDIRETTLVLGITVDDLDKAPIHLNQLFSNIAGNDIATDSGTIEFGTENVIGHFGSIVTPVNVIGLDREGTTLGDTTLTPFVDASQAMGLVSYVATTRQVATMIARSDSLLFSSMNLTDYQDYWLPLAQLYYVNQEATGHELISSTGVGFLASTTKKLQNNLILGGHLGVETVSHSAAEVYIDTFLLSLGGQASMNLPYKFYVQGRASIFTNIQDQNYISNAGDDDHTLLSVGTFASAYIGNNILTIKGDKNTFTLTPEVGLSYVYEYSPENPISLYLNDVNYSQNFKSANYQGLYANANLRWDFSIPTSKQIIRPHGNFGIRQVLVGDTVNVDFKFLGNEYTGSADIDSTVFDGSIGLRFEIDKSSFDLTYQTLLGKITQDHIINFEISLKF